MAASVAAMGLAELASFLVANGSYATAAEAMAALNIVIVEEVGAAAGTALAVTGGPASTAIGTVGETALELAARAQLAASGTGVRTASIGLLQGETTTGAAAILGVEMGAVAAAAAPLLGVALGADLYSSNPELWTKISQKLLPFCYPGTTKIPTWAEIGNDIWQASIAKRILDALKRLFEEEGIGSGDNVSSSDNPFGLPSFSFGIRSEIYYSTTSSYTLPSDTYVTKYPGDRYAIGARTDYSARTTLSYTYNGKTVYYGGLETNQVEQGLPECSEDVIDKRKEAAWIMIYGDSISYAYPEGTSQYTGPSYPSLPESKPAVTGIDSTTGQVQTQPMVPIAPPIIIIVPETPEVQPQPETIPFPWPEPSTDPHTEPWPTEMPWPLPEEQPEWWPVEIPYPGTYPVPQPTPAPEEVPDPTEITQPEEQIEPWILPLPIPWEVPVPYPQPVTDPTLDPTRPRPPVEQPTVPPSELGPDIIPPIGITPWPTIPDTPLPFSQNVGLVTVYHPTPAQLYAFEQWLWVTLSQASIETVWNNPFDGVITLFELYCTPTDVGNRTIHSGFLDSGINSAVISRYTEIDCGTIGIPEYYGNYFDYSPYSKAHVYLPFIGIQELNVDDIVGHAVNITYRIDEYNGSCIAMITVAKVTEVNGEPVEYSNTMYQFSGNCSVELPISGGSQAQIKAGLMMADATRQAATIAAGAGLIGGLASLLTGSIGGGIGQLGGAAATMAYGEASALGHMLSGKSTVQKSGSFGSSHGAMGIKTPFIVVTRPKQIQVPNYQDLYGYPAHKMVFVGNCTGFLRCREVHVVSATANDEEKAMIENLLKTGVYVTE